MISVSSVFKQIAGASLVPILAVVPAAAGPAASDTSLPLLIAVSQYGITWTFDRAVPCGQFINGDWYVVGEATVTGISPEPIPGRHGSILNLTVNSAKTGFDDRLQGSRYDPRFDVFPPVTLRPGDALISSISVSEVGLIPNMLRPSDRAAVPVRTAAVLTSLAEAVPPDTFRPGYCDRSHTSLRSAGQLRRDLLPQLSLDGVRLEWEHGPLTPAFMARVFERPWIDTITFEFASPMENMPVYGREIVRAAGMGSLLLCADVPWEEKEPLLINMVQVGIDLWSIVEAGGYAGWYAHGGHGSGRKWLIAFAGLMLGDERMAAPSKTYPEFRFGEDEQTVYGTSWTGAGVIFGGHSKASEAHPDWGRYEHLHPSEWPGNTGENYRRCCTGHAWIGQALAARILEAQANWDHPAFFDYVDRWMTEDDTEAIRIIKQHRGVDYSAGYMRQCQTWDAFVADMWNKYR